MEYPMKKKQVVLLLVEEQHQLVYTLEKIQLKELNSLLQFSTHFSLFIINCEGCEYAILRKLLQSPHLMNAIDAVLVQFSQAI